MTLRLSGSIQKERGGKFPSVAINSGGTIVEVHQPSILSHDICYQVGKGDETPNEIVWSDAKWMDKGKFPKIALNNDGRVVEVHEGRFTRRIYYRVGEVKGGFSITWAQGTRYICWGRFPAVAVHNNRVLISYEHAHFKYSSYYRTGTINQKGKLIDWKVTGEKLFDSAVTETSVSMNEECAIVAGRGWMSIICRIGRIQGENYDINVTWMNEIACDRRIGYCPTVCLQSNGNIIMVWQSLALRQLIYMVGKIGNEQNPSIEWQASRNYDYGYNPTFSLSQENGKVLEEHETNFGNTIYYHTGIFQN